MEIRLTVHEPTGEEKSEQVRDWLVRCLERDIVGPSWIEGTTESNLEEELDVGAGDPSRFYLTGMLAHRERVDEPEGIPPEHMAGSNSGQTKGTGVKTMTHIMILLQKQSHGTRPGRWA